MLIRLQDYHLLRSSFPGEFIIISEGIIAHHISAEFSPGDSVCPVPFSLAAIKGIIVYFLFLPVLRCFNSRRSSPSRDAIAGMFHIRKSQVQSLHAATLGLSQLATSFFKVQAKLSF